MQKNINKIIFLFLFLILITSCAVKNPFSNNPKKESTFKPIVSICIDDGYEDSYEVAAPILRKFNYPVTFGIVTSKVTTHSWAVTWEQLDTLKTLYHWEIASHSVTHPHLDRLNDTEFMNELIQSKQTLANHGFFTDTFIVPYGAMTERQLSIARKYYKNIRFAHDHVNVNPLIRYRLWSFELDQSATFEKIRERIDKAFQEKEPILIFIFHHVRENPESYFDITPDKLNETLNIIKEKNLEVLTLHDALEKKLGDKDYQ